MLQGGVQRRYLRRRLIAIAWDDIGLADPNALQLVGDAVKASERLGGEEGDVALAQAVLLLACATKSNAGGMAYLQARAWVASDNERQEPPHLRRQPEFERAAGAGCCAPALGPLLPSQHYLPDGMPAPHWYRPVSRGFEAKLAARLEAMRSKQQ
ncbi:hypothetical protein RNI54_006432 [Pseudomonas putida]|nr:hypothetical protein [Pseudomonas putida]